MSGWKKLASAAAASGEVTNVESVFSTYLYVGNSSSQTITNGIDLAGEGGMVWAKCRDVSYNNLIWDSERGSTNGTAYDILFTNLTNASNSAASYGVTSFNSDGFTLGPSSQQPISNQGGASYADLTYASWTFRKAPKFFDVVTYTGNGNDSRTISHNLSSTPGFAIVKRTNSSGSWICWHRGISDGTFLTLNATSAQTSHGSYPIFAGASSFSDTTVTLGGGSGNLNKTLYNNSGDTYVLYLFAHNDGDGEFGPTGDQDIIKCGSYSGDGTEDGSNEIDLGFEPQWIMIKRTNASDDWIIIDTMRGWVTGVFNNDNKTQRLSANSSLAEVSDELTNTTSTGFMLRNNSSKVNASGSTYIYIAIRRGLMAVPESGTDVFAMDTAGATSPTPPTFNAGFPVDGSLMRLGTTSAQDNYISARLTQGKYLNTNSSSSESSNTTYPIFDYQEGHGTLNATLSTFQSWMWRRASSFFDVVAWKGSSASTRTLNHNLGVAPEMIWAKNRKDTDPWYCYHTETGNTKSIPFSASTPVTSSAIWNNTTPSATTFSVGNNLNWSTSFSYIAYLFATVAGVSKVGSYTGNGSNQTIDCGFSSGARFILIKRIDAGGNWYIWDTERGIVAGNDPFLELNTTSPQNSSYDSVDPDSSGFIVNQDAGTNINVSSATYIFYAIA